ncbi:SLATT domain-containing protein [Rahnella aquatilis]|uniref:SLATT domain-containing protein n=1 Tax=Rahnella aquatilis TaxID=34038 RepID=UPI000907BBC3|nr:SLATT domain-containing protein [Rahnella aquatilis]
MSQEQNSKIKLSDSIWFTFKARMIAYERLKSNEFHSQMILVWYTLILVVISIVLLKNENFFGDNIDLYSAIFSVVILVVSLIVSNQDFRGRSIHMRANYLELQELYRSIYLGNSDGTHIDDFESEYAKILSGSENHSRFDDLISRLRSGSGLTSRRLTCWEGILSRSIVVLRAILLLFLYITPVALIIKNFP